MALVECFVNLPTDGVDLIKNFATKLRRCYLHDGDGGDGGVGEWVFVSQRAGVGGTLAETDFEGVHQTAEQLDQLLRPKMKQKRKKNKKTKDG